MIHAFYDPQMSTRGVMMCAVKTARKVEPVRIDGPIGYEMLSISIGLVLIKHPDSNPIYGEMAKLLLECYIDNM